MFNPFSFYKSMRQVGTTIPICILIFIFGLFFCPLWWITEKLFSNSKNEHGFGKFKEPSPFSMVKNENIDK